MTDYATPWLQAKAYAHTYNDPSTVRTAVLNDWGYAPDLETIAKYRAFVEVDEQRKISRKYGEGHDGGGVTYDNKTAWEGLEAGSEKLLRKLWENHQRVLLVAEACGRQVVRL